MTYPECQKLFAQQGFVFTPLNERQLNELNKRGYSEDEIYCTGCDVHSGILFTQAMEENVA